MKLTLSAPSKTFLVGEYAVLANGPALVLNTRPRFELRVSMGEGRLSGLPAGSPAARWLKAREPLLSKFDIEFHDPHAGAGGLGASGAQFLLVHTLTTWLQVAFARALQGPDLKAVWNDLQVLSSGQGSGADVLAQTVGGVALVQVATTLAEPHPWPYPELAWSIVRTHQKVATHEHLAGLDRQALSLLVAPASETVSSFGRAGWEIFLGHVQTFAARLRDGGLQAAHALSLVKVLEAEPWCLLAKGCGALGADTVLLFYASPEREKANAFLKRNSLQVIASERDLTGGLEMGWSCA